MEKGARTRARMLEATATLLRRRGYQQAALSQVLEMSGAPRGSLYFHFPGGKDEMAREALALSAGHWQSVLEGALFASEDLETAIRGVCALLASALKASGYRDGCPLATTVLERASEDDELQRLASAHYGRWERILARRFEGQGLNARARARLAGFVLSAVEGALLLARAYRDDEPLLRLPDLILAMTHAMGRAGSKPKRRRRVRAGRSTRAETTPTDQRRRRQA